MDGYGIFIILEEPAMGDGFRVRYYNNEVFLGEFEETTSSSVDFNWFGRSPHPSVKPENYSVE